jgi:hypothetical protein
MSLFSNERGDRVADRLVVNQNPAGEGYLVEFLNIPIGTYTVRISKEGMRTITLEGVGVQRNQTTQRQVEFERDDLDSSLGRLIVTTNLEEVDMEVRDQRGNREVRTVYDGFFRDDFEPGNYTIRFTPSGYGSQARNL